jgi:hypothetical protein
MLRFRELEHTALYAGLGVSLLDAHTGTAAFGWTKIELDIDDGGTWRPIEHPRAVTAAGVSWFPWLERHRDARGLLPRKYRVRVAAGIYTPRYGYDSAGIEALVAPYDDVTVPPTPARPIEVELLPSAGYPFAPEIPVLRGVVVDPVGDPVPYALVSWIDAVLVTDSVLTDADGEFDLPMRRAPLNTAIDVRAERPAPPIGGRAGDVIVRVPQDLATFQTIQIA